MKLYQIAQNYKNLEQLLNNEEVPKNILEEALNSVSDDINVKSENICKVLKNINADIVALKEEEKRLATLRKSLENKYKNLFNYLEMTLKQLNIKKIDSKYFKISIAKNPPKLILSKDFKADSKYIKIEETINNTAIKEDLKQGVQIDGATLIQEESLRIK